MVRHTLHVNRPKLTSLGVKEMRRSVAKVVRRTDNRSAVLCPVDTGYLRSSRTTGVAVRGYSVVGEVVYRAEYAAAVHNGRRGLTIRSRNGKLLRFVVDGRVVYARRVRQPPRRGRPFLFRALRQVATSEGYTVVRGGYSAL